MAEVQAGQQPNAQDEQQQQQQQQQQQAPKQESKVYQQADVDRIVDKVRKNAARDAELRLRRELQASPAAAQPSGEQEKKEPPKVEEPKREAYATYEEYVEARADFKSRQAVREERQKEAEEERKAKETETLKTREQEWHGRIKKAAGKHSDFQTVMEDSEETLALIHGSPMRAFIVESEVGPEIILELCRNSAEAKRIADLPTRKQAAEITKIEEKLEAAGQKPNSDDEGDPKEDDPEKEGRERNEDGTFKTPQKKETPKGPPPPIEPGSGRSASNSAMPSDKDDADTWRRKELARMAKRQQGK